MGNSWDMQEALTIPQLYPTMLKSYAPLCSSLSQHRMLYLYELAFPWHCPLHSSELIRRLSYILLRSTYSYFLFAVADSVVVMYSFFSWAHSLLSSKLCEKFFELRFNHGLYPISWNLGISIGWHAISLFESKLSNNAGPNSPDCLTACLTVRERNLHKAYLHQIQIWIRIRI
jgi:hypothetical protein